MHFQEIRLIKELTNRDPGSILLANFKVVFDSTSEILAHEIPVVFHQYTIHDINHSIRIMEYMYDLISDIKQLDEIEIIVLCYSAILHDIGMAVQGKELDDIKSGKYQKNDLSYLVFLKIHDNDEQLALQEFIRKIHAARSNDYVIANLSNKLHIPSRENLTFHEELGKICQSHNESFSWIFKYLAQEEILGDQSYNSQYCACLLRLADILDIDDKRTPYKLYKFINPTGNSDVEWRLNSSVKNDKKLIRKSGDINLSIVFSGDCTNPKLHQKLLSYFAWVQEEVKGCLQITRSMPTKYNLNLNENLQINIKPKGYTFAENKMHVDFRAVTDLLAGERLYGDVRYGLRELIQNSLDACQVRKEDELKNQKIGYKYVPTINIVLDSKENQVIIKDNGTGMDLSIIRDYFLNVGTSYYKSLEFKLKNYAFNPIGNFGIGFLACFMLSSNIKIITRRTNSPKKYEIDLEKLSEFTSITESEDLQFEGTMIILNYSQFNNAFPGSLLIEIKKFLEENFVIGNVVIEIIDLAISYSTKIRNNISFILNKGKQIYVTNKELGLDGYFEISEPISLPIVYKFEDIFAPDALLKENLYFLQFPDTFERYDGSQEINDYFMNGSLQILKLKLSNIDFLYSQEILSDAGFSNEWLQNDLINKSLWEMKNITIIVNPILLWHVENRSNDVIFIPLNSLTRYIDIQNETIEKILEIQEVEMGFELMRLDFVKIKKYDAFLPVPDKERSNFTSDFVPEIKKTVQPIEKFYLKNVLIKDAKFDFNFEMIVYSIIGYKVNFTGSGINTNVSREKINFNDTNSFKKYVKAIHSTIISHLSISTMHKLILTELLDYRLEIE